MKIERADLPGKLRSKAEEGFLYLAMITAVDFVRYITVIYVIRDLTAHKEETLEVDIDPSDAWIPSMMSVYKACDWYERELSEMFGIEVRGRHAQRLLLEGWDGKIAPLRKNFSWGT